MTGHLSRETPSPNYGKLGKVRERAQINTPTLAEILHYNVDGVGRDGTEFLPFFDGVQSRAINTGYRWLMVEMPSLDQLQQIRIGNGRDPGGPDYTMEDVLEGFRPYLVEYSPINVPFFVITNGQLDMAIIRHHDRPGRAG